MLSRIKSKLTFHKALRLYGSKHYSMEIKWTLSTIFVSCVVIINNKMMTETVNAAVENMHIDGDHKAWNNYIVS